MEDSKTVQINPQDSSKTVRIGTTLDPKGKGALVDFLRANLDKFAWKPSDMKGIPAEVA
jgi:hypothetical protein